MSRFYDQKKNLLPTDKFTQNTLQLYLEYGLLDGFTIGANPTYAWVRANHTNQHTKNNALIDTEVWGRYRVYENKGHVVSAQALVSIPGSYKANKDPILGYQQSDLEGRMLYGYSAYDVKIPWFFKIETAYRMRTKGPADEVRVDGSFGINITKRFMFLVESFNTIGQRNSKIATAFSPVNPPDYDLYKTSLSLVCSLTESNKVRVRLGYDKDLYGRNVGCGQAFVLGLWLSM